MKKYIFLLFLVFLVISVYAQNAGDYNKILNGNLSAFVGYWVDENNDRIYLQSDGTTLKGLKASGFKKKGDVYSWGINAEGDEGGGFTAMLFPVGADVYGYDSTAKNVIIKSDKTRVRLFFGQDYPFESKQLFYKKSEFPITHIVSENLRLKTDQNLSSETLNILKKGTKVLVHEWGNNVSIDGKNARWAYIFTVDGLQGWCYSGYLKELKK